MRYAFQQYQDIHQILSQSSCSYLQDLQNRIGQFDELQDLLEKAIIDAPPVLVRDGGVIAPGYNSELDEWRALADGANRLPR